METTNEIELMLTDLESHRFERTESTTKNEKFCEAICAFANDIVGSGQPGYLFIGVDKSGVPVGITVDERLLEILTNLHASGQILPIPTVNVRSVAVQGKSIAVVRVEPSDAPPVRYKGVVWVRRGPARGVATQEEERRLSERHVNRAKTWDRRVCPGATMDDLALDLFTLNYLPKAVSRDVLRANGREPREQLASLRLFDMNQDTPTNGAILLFGKDPLGLVPSAYVQYVRYDGIDRAADPIAERRLSGDLRQVFEGLHRLAEEISRPRPVRMPDLSDRTVFDYPPEALQELFANAVIHRNYEGSGTPVSINHFNDRIELQNPGGLYGDLTEAQFPNGTAYRNPALAEAAKTWGYVNMFGSGVAVARRELANNQNPQATVDIGDSHLAWTLRARP